ncbi:MAG: hypothetical protein ACE5FT_00175 [Candidatus Nanoarchaeia archaeon]
MRLTIVLLGLILLLVACESVPEERLLVETDSGLFDVSEPKAEPKPFCGDGFCQDNENKCTCVEDCGVCEGNVSSTSHWQCVENECKVVKVANQCGNGICESGEFGTCSDDCPTCEDSNKCTNDRYDVDAQQCRHDKIEPCCGDGICHADETNTCLDDCGSTIDLSDFPKPFVKNDQFQSHLVVGSSGQFQPELIISAISIMNGLEFDSVRSTYSKEAKLDNEFASIDSRNVILVGGPCQNSFVKELMPYHNKCDEAIPSSGALIRLFKTGPDTFALAVMGRTGVDVRRAGKFLERQKSMSGYEANP